MCLLVCVRPYVCFVVSLLARRDARSVVQRPGMYDHEYTHALEWQYLTAFLVYACRVDTIIVGLWRIVFCVDQSSPVFFANACIPLIHPSNCLLCPALLFLLHVLSDTSGEAVLVGIDFPHQVLSCRGTGEKAYDRTGLWLYEVP